MKASQIEVGKKYLVTNDRDWRSTRTTGAIYTVISVGEFVRVNDLRFVRNTGVEVLEVNGKKYEVPLSQFVRSNKKTQTVLIQNEGGFVKGASLTAVRLPEDEALKMIEENKILYEEYIKESRLRQEEKTSQVKELTILADALNKFGLDPQVKPGPDGRVTVSAEKLIDVLRTALAAVSPTDMVSAHIEISEIKGD